MARESQVKVSAPAWWVGLGFAALAVVLATASPKAEVPVTKSAAVNREVLKPGPRRVAMTDPPTYRNGGFDHRCNACHRLFESRPVTPAHLIQHTQIVLNHGMNNRCFNCHDRKNREKLVLMRGVLGGFDDAVMLCAKCHGPAYRDWQNGTHGKTLGSWQAGDKQRRLICTECHDPHSPAYPGIVPLPAPSTLRMGEQDANEPAEENDQSPLRFRGPTHDQ